MASRIERPATAFSISKGQRRPRERNRNHLAWIASLPSLISGKRGCEAAHIRMGSQVHGKRSVGLAEKPDDMFTVPLTASEHRTGDDSQHACGDERAWWARHGIDPIDVALRLWAASGDDERGEVIIHEARARGAHDVSNTRRGPS
jgi:hypothetical protein